MPDNKPISIRTDEETAARFKEITANFPNAAEAFRALISAHEMAQAKGAIPGTETAINDFQSHLDFIMRGYLAALDTIANTEERIKQKFQERLESKDKIIFSLQAKAEQYKAEAAAAAQGLQEVTERTEAESKEAAKIEANLIAKAEAAEQARMTAERATATTEAANRALSETNAALKEKLTLSEAEAGKARELETKLKEAETRTASLERELEQIKAAAELTKEKAAVETMKAISEERTKAAEAIRAAAMESKALYAEISELKAQVAALTAQAAAKK